MNMTKTGLMAGMMVLAVLAASGSANATLNSPDLVSFTVGDGGSAYGPSICYFENIGCLCYSPNAMDCQGQFGRDCSASLGVVRGWEYGLICQR